MNDQNYTPTAQDDQNQASSGATDQTQAQTQQEEQPSESTPFNLSNTDSNSSSQEEVNEEQAIQSPAEDIIQPTAATIKQEPTPPIFSESDEFEAALNAMESGVGQEEVRTRLSKGETITATVIQVDKDRAFVDLGTKAEGMIPFDELSNDQINTASDVVKVGDQIRVVVIKPGSSEGNPIVSKKLADFEEIWEKIVQDHKEGRTISAMVKDRVKGGLEVDIGVPGFVPASHVGSGKSKNLGRYVGQSLKLKILDVDHFRKKVVLSNRLAEEEYREEKKKHVFEEIKPGMKLKGKIRRLVEYGAFVDIDGVDGLLHVSEISWSRIEHPSEELSEGDTIEVMVLRTDPEKGRISLGRRQVLPDPWSTIRESYHNGQRMKVVVNRVVQSGAFVKLPEGAEAFIPVSEMSHKRINKPSDVVNVGDEVEVQVIELRPEERRMVLSMRALLPFEIRDPVSKRTDHQRRHRGERGQKGQDSGDSGRGATIGERLGALKGIMPKNEEGEDIETEVKAEHAEVEMTPADDLQQQDQETPQEKTQEETSADITSEEEIQESS
jgi:ribosomal protein S1